MNTHSVSAQITGISPGASRAIRGSAIASAVIIAICATALSYSGLHSLALRAGVEPHLAFVWPVIVDGLQLVGSLGVMYSTLSRISTRYPWFLMLLGTAISVAGNWVSAPKDLTSQILHAAAPLVLAQVLEELMRVARHKVSAATAEADRLAAQPAVPAPNPALVDVPRPAPAAIPVAPAKPAASRADTVAARDATPVPASSGASPWPTKATAEQPVTSDAQPALATQALPVVEQPTVQSHDAASAAPQDEPVEQAKAADRAPEGDGEAPQRTLRERISDYLDQNPDATARDVYKALGTEPKYTRTIYKEVLAARSDA